MATKANWHAPALDIPDMGDPFAEVPTVADPTAVGVEIDLTGDPEKLERAFNRSFRRESNLFQMGVTCPIRDRQDTCCSACPVARPMHSDEDLRLLCREGKEQERLLTALAVMRHGG